MILMLPFDTVGWWMLGNCIATALLIWFLHRWTRKPRSKDEFMHIFLDNANRSTAHYVRTMIPKDQLSQIDSMYFVYGEQSVQYLREVDVVVDDVRKYLYDLYTLRYPSIALYEREIDAYVESRVRFFLRARHEK